ncbi:MAG: FHA domain-containing protein [Actinomycetota bacterium]|nr:FHA domain-containing protein [Actinomycetota bacterium]
MLELQVPLLAAKALLLLLLFAFVYAVVRRGIGDLRDVPDDDGEFVAGAPQPSQKRGRAARPRDASELIVEGSDIFAPGTQFALENGSVSIGRSSGSDVVVKSDDYASGRHAQLSRHGGLLYVEDLGSTNGTFVNGQKAVGATPLRDGDTVKVGSTTFRFVE